MPLSSTKTQTIRAICLRAFDYREADRIATLYSPERGRFSAIGKGVKRQKSKLAGACETLNVSDIQMVEGKNMGVITEYQMVESFIALRADLLKLSMGQLLAEIVDCLGTEHDHDSKAVFDLLVTGLHQLETAQSPQVAAVVTDIQMQLLSLAGYQPELSQCLNCGAAMAIGHTYYHLCVELGGLLCRDCVRLMPEQAVIQVSTRTLAMMDRPFEQEYPLQTRVKVQKFMHYYWAYKLERHMKGFPFVIHLLETEPA
jgi:DNA repair protein RecO (recombination protein O)